MDLFWNVVKNIEGENRVKIMYNDVTQTTRACSCTRERERERERVQLA